MNAVNVLFLGASKRVSLLERFVEAAAQHSIDLALFSCEMEERFYPICGLAHVIAGPKFLADEFGPWLNRAIERHSIDIVIPNMDWATVALSRFADSYTGLCWLVVSSYLLIDDDTCGMVWIQDASRGSA